MRDPKWIGTSLSGTLSNNDGITFSFWNPDKDPNDSTWSITSTNTTQVKATVLQKQTIAFEINYNYIERGTAYVYAKDGDIIYKDVKKGKPKHTDSGCKKCPTFFSYCRMATLPASRILKSITLCCLRLHFIGNDCTLRAGFKNVKSK